MKHKGFYAFCFAQIAPKGAEKKTGRDRERKREYERETALLFVWPQRKHDTALYDGQFVNVSIECTGLA